MIKFTCSCSLCILFSFRLPHSNGRRLMKRHLYKTKKDTHRYNDENNRQIGHCVTPQKALNKIVLQFPNEQRCSLKLPIKIQATLIWLLPTIDYLWLRLSSTTLNRSNRRGRRTCHRARYWSISLPTHRTIVLRINHVKLVDLFLISTNNYNPVWYRKWEKESKLFDLGNKDWHFCTETRRLLKGNKVLEETVKSEVVINL